MLLVFPQLYLKESMFNVQEPKMSGAIPGSGGRDDEPETLEDQEQSSQDKRDLQRATHSCDHHVSLINHYPYVKERLNKLQWTRLD
jgi:hypothetical protein